MRSDLFAGVKLGFLLGASFLALASCSAPPSPESFANTDLLAEEIRNWRTQSGSVPDPMPVDTHPFARVIDTIRTSYVRPTDDRWLVQQAVVGMRERIIDPKAATDADMVSAALHGMLASLDPYSAFLDRGELNELREEISGRFGGLGVRLTMRDGQATVIAAIEGTPAFRAGLKPNDIITHADGAALAGKSLPEIIDMLRGRPGSRVVLKIARDKVTPFDVELTRAIIHMVSVESQLVDDVGHVRVRSFTEGVSDEVQRDILRLKVEAGSRLRGVVLDMRGNPGGLLSEAVRVSDLFLEDGLVVYTRSRNGGENFGASTGDILDGLPIAVLIDEGSASASEIVAGALQDSHRAVLIGGRSFGKGSVQKIFSLPLGQGIKITTELYFTPSGRTVEGGIEPDLSVAQDEAREGDEVLDTAVARLIGLTGGPDAMWNTPPVQASR